MKGLLVSTHLQQTRCLDIVPFHHLSGEFELHLVVVDYIHLLRDAQCTFTLFNTVYNTATRSSFGLSLGNGQESQGVHENRKFRCTILGGCCGFGFVKLSIFDKTTSSVYKSLGSPILWN